MKLKNNIILTLPDFIKYFDCGEFWQNRDVFERDMHPDKIYYWDKEDEDRYKKIVEWIKDENNEEKQEKGLAALSEWVGRTLSLDMFVTTTEGNVSLEEPVIYLSSGNNYVLPQFRKEAIGDSAFNITMHKLEFCGDLDVPIKVSLGECKFYYNTGDIAYITAINNTCVEILETTGKNDLFVVQLQNLPGKYESKLVFSTKGGKTTEITNVTSFALYESGIVYVRDGEVKHHNIPNPLLYNFFKQSRKPIYVKSSKDNDISMVLYANGILKTTEFEEKENYHGAIFDENNKIQKL